MTLNLKPVQDEVIEKLLIEVAARAKLKPKSAVVKQCTIEANGSPRQALAYLATAADAKSVEEAADLMASATESKEAIELARALSKGADWKQLKGIVKTLQGQNPESVRIMVCRYHTAIAINAGGHVERRSLAVLEHFERPYDRQEGLTPIVLACARLTKAV
jgi:hypothetical protein